jgi:hypothetical protein
MAGISGLGTNYNLPNYTGILFQLTPSDSPFFSAIGGLTGGLQTTSTEFEWETFDLRDAAQPENVEGATAPTAQGRVRANVANVVQIHQEKVSVAYSKIAAFGQKSGTNNEAMNPVRNEVDWQVEQTLKQMVRDAEYSFLRGAYQKPGNNSTGRKTRGILAAVTTNAFDVGAAANLPTVTATASTDKVNSSAHGLNNGEVVIFSALTGGAGLVVGQPYYVVNKGTNDFEVSLTKGGAKIDITSDASAATARKLTTLTTQHVGDAMQSAYDNGGITDSTTATLVCNSSVKRALTVAYADAYGKFTETDRRVGGVAVDTIETDFGRVNVMLNRYMPKDTLLVASLEQCAPVFLEVPGKGHFFAEPLAKTGASDDVQLYGEVGLQYGNQAAHSKVAGVCLG